MARRQGGCYVTRKYHNTPITFFGQTFDSKHEAERYLELRRQEYLEEISELRTQVPFELVPEQVWNGKKIKPVRYIADFVYIDRDGNLVVEDAKSEATKTQVYKIKKKLMLERHGIMIREV